MAPKKGSLAAAFAPKEAKKETPKKDPAAEKDTPDRPDMPKRRRLDEAGNAEKKVEVRPAAPTAKSGTDVNMDSTGPMSLWATTAGASQKDMSSAAYDPAQRSTEFPTGKAVPFALVSDTLKSIEDLKGSGKGSRKVMTVLLSNLFRTLIYSRPEDLVPTLYILINKVAPDYEESELGVGDGLIMKTICDVFSRTAANINTAMMNGDAKDLGEIALQSKTSQKTLFKPARLSIEKVFGEMKALAHTSGKDSQKVKKDKIQKMLVASQGEEVKFIVRMLQAKLRIGIQTPTVLQAIAYAFVLTAPKRDSQASVSDVRKAGAKTSGDDLEKRMVSMETAVKQAFCELPNFETLVNALMSGHSGETLHEVCHISMGIPVKPMLAKPSKGIAEVAERLTGVRFTGEYKYDGERAQIHVLSRDNIKIFSRNSENMTEKYPDVIAVVQEALTDSVESCIIDSELVAFDQTNRRILPFQVLTTRGRKNIKIEDIKVNVCIYPFDCVLHNGTPIVKDTLENRRKKLYSCLKEIDTKVIYAVHRDFDELVEENVQAFLDESIEASCEGLMLKTLDTNATYEPSRRSLNWLKLKKDYLDGVGDSIDVVPIGAFYGKGKRTGSYGAFLLAIYNQEDEEFQTVCKAGTGFSDEDLVTHYNFFKERTRPNPDSNYNVSDKLKPDVWLEACQVWEIKCADLSISPVHTSAIGVKADGKGIGLRFPRFLRIRDDKSPEEATSSEQIVDMFESQASIGKDGGGGDDDW